MRKIGVVIALAALGPGAGVASGKELEQVLACGGAGCRDVTARVPHDESMLGGGFVDTGPKHRAAFYRVRFTFGDGTHRDVGRWYALYVPSRGLLGSTDESGDNVRWTRLDGKVRRRFRRAVRGLRPLPAARMSRSAIPRDTHVDVSDAGGALPPEVIEAPVEARDGGGLDARPMVAIGLGLAGAAGFAIRRRRRRS